MSARPREMQNEEKWAVDAAELLWAVCGFKDEVVTTPLGGVWGAVKGDLYRGNRLLRLAARLEVKANTLQKLAEAVLLRSSLGRQETAADSIPFTIQEASRQGREHRGN